MEIPKASYIHGSHKEEQDRLSLLNIILNHACLERMIFKGQEHILDVGSGLGQFTRLMAQQLDNGKVVGVERDKHQFTKAIALAKEDKSTAVDFRQGDAYALPLKKEEWNSFDIVFSRFLLEHLAEPKKAINQMAKAVKVGGRVILTDDDHATYRPTPEPVGFSIIWTAYMRSYERLGNDPFIGRNLPALLYQCQLKPIRLTSVFFGACAGEASFEMVANNLIGILEGAKELMIKEHLIDEVTFTNCIQSLHVWKKRPDAALCYSIDWAEGLKEEERIENRKKS